MWSYGWWVNISTTLKIRRTLLHKAAIKVKVRCYVGQVASGHGCLVRVVGVVVALPCKGGSEEEGKGCNLTKRELPTWH